MSVLVNGISVVASLRRAGVVDTFDEDILAYENGPARGGLRVFRAVAESVSFFGWNRPLAGALAARGRARLVDWVKQCLGERTAKRRLPAAAERSRPPGRPRPNEDGFIPVGTVVHSVGELGEVLADWLLGSNRPTIGDIGAFGGSALITVRLDDAEFVLNRDTKRSGIEAFLDAAARAGGAARLDWRVTAGRRGKINRVTYRPDDAPTPGWYAYLSKPRSRRAKLAMGSTDAPAGELRVVQFVHPGFEYHLAEHVGRRGQHSGVMAWKAGQSKHDRKFMLARGSFIDWARKSDHSSADIGFWGEWEGPSVYWRVDSPGKPLPSIVHAPFLPARRPEAPVQNTDPLVFGDAFIYSNCLQASYRSLRELPPGSIVLFGRYSCPGGIPSFGLDTCLVIERCEEMTPHPPGDPGADLIDEAVLGPLFSEEVRQAVHVYSGRMRCPGDADGPFSFFPARLAADGPPLFSRPTLVPIGPLEGILSPTKMQGIKVTTRLDTMARDAIWESVVAQVTAQRCGLGYRVGAPPVLDSSTVSAASERAPHSLASSRVPLGVRTTNRH